MKIRAGQPGGSPPCPRSSDAAAFVSGELDDECAARFAAHAAGCPACSHAVDAVRRTMADLRALPEPGLSRDLAPAILARIGTERRGVAPPADRPVFRLAWRIAAAAALVAVLGGSAMLALRPAPSPKATATGPRDRGADWLCRIQGSDGSWSAGREGGAARHEVALTSLALMALLGDEALPSHRAAAARRAAVSLCARQGPDGSFGPATGDAPCRHGMATLALLRAWERFRDPALREPIDRALAHIATRRASDDRWSYGGAPGIRRDSSIAYWQTEALRLAGEQGWTPAGAGAGDRQRGTTAIADDRGFFGYGGAGRTAAGARAMAAMDALAVLASPDGPAPTDAQLAAVTQRAAESAAGRGPAPDYYRSFLLAQTLRRMPESGRNVPLEALRSELLGRQVPDGEAGGSFDPDSRWGAIGGRVYSTALALLALR